MHLQPRERVNLRAFTLIEMMVVVVLIGVLVALVIPEMKGTYDDAVLRSTARKFVDVFVLANSQAVAGNRKHLVRIDTQGRKFMLETSAATGGLQEVDITGSAGEFDDRIRVDVRNAALSEREGPPDQEVGKGERERGVIAFYPDGTADAGDVLLRDRAGFRLLLRINPATARVRVMEPEHE